MGEARDIHPKNKLDVGRRMARWALADVYGRKLTAAGPMFGRMKVGGSKIVLTFEDVGTGLKIPRRRQVGRVRRRGRRPQVALGGGAHRRPRQGRSLVKEVPRPVAARYAFNNNPRRPNLTNDTGLPAAPFRTDDWPDPTAGKR